MYVYVCMYVCVHVYIIISIGLNSIPFYSYISVKCLRVTFKNKIWHYLKFGMLSLLDGRN